MMALVCPLIAVTYSSIYMLIPPLMIFGLSGPVIATPVLPSIGEVVKDMVRSTTSSLTDLILSILIKKGGDAYAQGK